MISALGEALPLLAIFALIYLAYRLDVRRQRREAERRWLFEKQRAARYFELEFRVEPQPFDWSCDVEWKDAA